MAPAITRPPVITCRLSFAVFDAPAKSVLAAVDARSRGPALYDPGNVHREIAVLAARRLAMIDLVRKDDARPLCPHCHQELQQVWYRELASALGRRYLYFCSHCRATLGVSHRKGFWMG